MSICSNSHNFFNLVLLKEHTDTSNALHISDQQIDSAAADFNLSIEGRYARDLDFTTENIAVFAENQFKVSEKFSVTPGVRYEYIKNTGEGRFGISNVNDIAMPVKSIARNQPLFGLGLEYKFLTTNIYANITQAFRPVLFSDFTPPAVTDVIDPNLKDASGFNADLGFRGTYKNYLNFDFSLFYLSYNNRIGGVMIAEVARRLKEKGKELPFKLYIVNSVQEEIGLRGAQMVTQTIKPNVAIITDVCHETSSPCYTASKEGEHVAGQGGVITRAPAVHNKLRKLVLDVADKKDIPVQLAASSTSTGTDTDAFAYSNGGVPSVLISLPLKYMHTTCETVHKDDVKSIVKLIYQTLLNIEENHNFKYNA